MSNWNVVLSSTRNLNDVLIVLQKVLALLQNKADVTTIDEALDSLATLDQQAADSIREMTNRLNQFGNDADTATNEAIMRATVRGFATEQILKQWTPDFNGARAKADDTKKIWRWELTSAAGVTPITGNWVDTGLSELDQAIAYTDSALTDIDSTAFNTVGFVDSTGKSQISASFKRTDFIPVLPNLEYRIFSRTTGNARHAWYDANKVFISAFGDDQTVNSEKVVTSPANAAFLIVSAYLEQTWSIAYIKSKAYDIDELKKVMQLHAPNFDSSKINYNNTDVKVTLDKILQNQSLILQNQSNIESTLDLQSDKAEPYFVNNWHFTKVCQSVSIENALKIVDVTQRISDNAFMISDASVCMLDAGIVVFDPNLNSYTNHVVLKIEGSTITVSGQLPPNPTKAQSLYDGTNGQHLSLFGTKAHAQYVVEQLQKYAYKKAENRIFIFNPAYCAYKVWNDPDIYKSDGATKLVSVTRLGSASNGGYVTTAAGNTTLPKVCNISNALNTGMDGPQQYLSKAYQLSESAAGSGFEFSFNVDNAEGFLEIPISALNKAYKDGAGLDFKTSGRARLQVFADNISIHDKIYAVGQVEFEYIDFSNAKTIKVRVTCADSVPTLIYLCGVFAYKKSAKTSKNQFFKNGDVAAYLADSWSVYPMAATIGEPDQIRADGSISKGSHWLSRFMQEKLADQGINITIQNMGFGGQTSRWGKHWVSSILNLSPRPTHCILSFYINDNNSIGGTNPAYDFNPNDMFSNIPESAGGIRGRIDGPEEWEGNLKYICDVLLSANIKPVVFMPGATASTNQASGIRLRLLDRIAAGFN